MAQFNEYRIWLTIDGDTYAMHDYNGDDLVRANSLTKTETLHRDLDPVQDKAEFTLDWRRSLANKLITTSPVNKVDDTTYEPNIITCEIQEKRPSDSEWYAWFYGYVRPVEEWNIDQDDQTISIEVLDNSRKLEKTSPGYSTVRDRTFHEIVEDFLEDAGYNSTERELVANFTPSGVANATLVSYSLKADEKTFKEAISELILPFGYVYRFNAAGQFELVRWITEDSNTAGTVNEENMVGSLKVDRDSARAGWEAVNTGASEIEIDVPAEMTDSYVQVALDSHVDEKWDSGNTKTIRVPLNPDLPGNAEDIIEVRYYKLDLHGERRIEKNFLWWETGHTWSSSNAAWRVTPTTDISAFDGKEKSGRWRIESATADTYASGIDKELVFDIKNLHDDGIRLKSILVTGEVDYTVIANTVTVSVPDAVSRDILQVLRDIDDAKKLETAFEKRAEESVFHYTFRSTVEFTVGDQLELSNSALNILTNVVVLDRVFTYDNDVLIWEYECEGSAEISDLVGQVTQPTLIKSRPSDQQLRSMQERLDEAVSEDGFVQKALSSNVIKGPVDEDGTQLPFIPGETALFLTDEFLGFYNADEDEWVAYIRNDAGVGKMRVGDDDHNMEWDGAELYVRGAANIDGTITAGSGIVSENYAAGSVGWQIDGDGNAEFRSGNIGGWLLADILKSAASGRRIELDPTNNRVAIFDDVEAKVVQGYLDGLPKNDGSGDWGPTDYGFWARQGDRLRIDGTVEQVNGDWILDKDSAFLLSQVGPDETPFNGARRLRFGATEIGVDEYAGGSWVRRVTVDASSGIKTHTVRGTNALLLYSGDYSDIVQDGYSVGRSVPSGGEAYRFEQSYADLVAGDDEWTTKQNLSFTTDCRYGEHAITGDGASGARLSRGPWDDLNLDEDFTIEWWFKLSSVTTADYTPMWSAMAGEQGIRLGILHLTSEYASDSYASGYWESTPTDYSGQLQLAAWYTGRWEYLMLGATTGTWRYIGIIPDGGNVRAVFDNGDMLVGPAIAGSAPWDMPIVPSVTWHMDSSLGQIVDMLYVNSQQSATVSDILDRATDEVGFGSIDNDQKLVLYAKNGLIVGAPIIDGLTVQDGGLTVESGGADIRDDVLTQRPGLTSSAVLNASGATSGDVFATLDPYIPTVGDTVLVRGGNAEKIDQYMTKIENWMLAERGSSTSITLYGWEHTQSSNSQDSVGVTAGASRAVSEGSSSVIGDVFMVVG